MRLDVPMRERQRQGEMIELAVILAQVEKGEMVTVAGMSVWVEREQQGMWREQCEIGRPVRGQWQRRELKRNAAEDLLREHEAPPGPQMEAGGGVVGEEKVGNRRDAS
jgi:hypothetical protein